MATAGAGGTKVQVEGDERLARTLHQAAGTIGDLEAVNRRVGELIAEDARGRAPMLTGALRESIQPVATREFGAAEAQAEYAGVQEFGWRERGIPAHPYMWPAFQAREDTAVDLIEGVLEEAIQEVKGA